MKKYTLQDWLNDRIDYRLPGGQNILEALNGLYTLHYEKLLTRQDYDKIKSCQIKVYDTAVELTVKFYAWHFSKNYNKSPYKTEYLNNKIRITQELIDKNLDEKSYVLAGKKQYTTIKGSEYRKIIKDKRLIDTVATGEYRYSVYALNDNMRITGLYQHLQWLKNFKSKSVINDNKKFPSFESLFSDPQMAKEVKRILKENGYLDDAYRWISSGKLKRIALPYYILKDEVNEFGIISSGDEPKQLKIWCKEFGYTASYDKGAELSLKNLLNRPKYDPEEKPDYIEFLTLLEPLKEIR